MRTRLPLVRVGVMTVVIVAVWYIGALVRQHGAGSLPTEGFTVRPLIQGFSADFDGGMHEPSGRQVLAGYPVPETFQSFSMPGSAQSVRRLCKDVYLTLLVYRQDTDYRINPADAIINHAQPCTRGAETLLTVDPSDSGLLIGSYYMIVADQGRSGTWYDPR